MKLSRNEKMILWGLVKYPMLNDRQLSEMIGVRMSTLNAIKNKMKRTGLISDRIVPNLEVLDHELLSITWTQMNKVPRSKKDIEALKGSFGRWPGIYSSQVFGDTLLFISLHRNYSALKVTEHSIMNVLSEKDLLNPDQVHTTIYPLELSKINKNFDYTSVLESVFGQEKVDAPILKKPRTTEEAKEKISHLTKKEKTILKGILQYPDMPDNKVANMLGTTRQAVARHKKELLELGVINKLRVIDYASIGFNILCLVEAHYDKFKGFGRSAPDLSHLHLPSFFSIYGNYETVSLSLFQDFQQFSETREKYTSAMNQFCTVKGEPTIRLFSPKDTMNIKHLDFLPLMNEFLSET